MSAENKKLHPLIPAQALAVEPQGNIWLNASAGTGKTQVLTARVIRLLLTPGVRPENLLCITFTKAGAAEMAERINRLLASWVQKKGSELSTDLRAIGADSGPVSQGNARKLFARVLDALGGGLHILTIHSLCQSLLGSFPDEAGLVPGFKAVEGRERDELFREALSEMIVAAENDGSDWLIKNLQDLSISMGEDGALKFLRRCAAQPDVMATMPEDQGAIIFAKQLVGVTFEGSTQEFLEQSCLDSVIDRRSIEDVALMNEAWKTKTGLTRAATIRSWLSSSPHQRAENIMDLHKCWSVDKGTFRSGGTPSDDNYSRVTQELYFQTKQIVEQVKVAQYADRLAAALLVGKAYSARYAESKRSRGLVDFDDMIRKTAALLLTKDMSDWVRYKLDRQIDHILIDEAQDTNGSQWDIIGALSNDFFSGIAAKEDKPRTIFSVGDYKQAIFGFQGTDPERYRDAGSTFAENIGASGAALEQLSLSRSFRSTKPVLDFVNAVIESVGPATFGIGTNIERHNSGFRNVGTVELFKPVRANLDEESGDDDEEQWLSGEKRKLAHRISQYVRRLIDEAPILETTGKPLVPSDIMILLTSRTDLASFLVARLQAENVPVAGIDRLKLQEPLAVQDLLSAVRFALQPDDDLSLASLMVSPLIGWSHERFLKYGYRTPTSKISLWRHLRGEPTIADDIVPLRDILASADFTTPYHFLEQILSGTHQGRKKFVARLGSEALVPIEELLNLALQFEQSQGGGLQAFLAWFERGETEVTRNAVAGNNEVRVMTVHGAKGLEAPVVILANVTADPTKKPDKSPDVVTKAGVKIPLLFIKKEARSGQLEAIASRHERRGLEEHSRLLYVAMTRAKERLIMAGSLGKTAKGAHEKSWFTALELGMQAMGCAWEEDQIWGGVMRFSGDKDPVAAVTTKVEKQPNTLTALPDWILRAAPEERCPPRPLVPSQLGDDDYGDGPASRGMLIAAEKGRLIHGVFERWLSGDTETNLANARIWLERNNRDPAIKNEVLIENIKAVIANTGWGIFFGPSARAEVPLAAVVGQTVIAGRLDRLVIEPGLVRVLDFKTGRSVPENAAAVPTAYLRQMAHYVAALEVIFTGSKVEAALLFTHLPKLIALDEATLAPHRPAN
jgi:ATP-dependent helicase/nuclease subunit A